MAETIHPDPLDLARQRQHARQRLVLAVADRDAPFPLADELADHRKGAVEEEIVTHRAHSPQLLENAVLDALALDVEAHRAVAVLVQVGTELLAPLERVVLE